MRTFKLIEKYYNSPELGTIIREDGNGQLVSEKIEIFKLDEIIKYPKHWQEFAEIDYTGVKFKCGDCDIIYEIKEKIIDYYTLIWDNNSVNSRGKISEVHKYFENGAWTIINEQPRYIIGFDPTNGNDYSILTRVTENGHEFPLFKTFDDVEIFLGDKYYIVCPRSDMHIMEQTANMNWRERDFGYIYFKLIENARKYVNFQQASKTTLINELFELYLKKNK